MYFKLLINCLHTIILLMTVLPHQIMSQATDCNSKVPWGMARNGNSKYLYSNSWAIVGSHARVHDIERECKSRNLVTPDASHYHDWMNLQTIARSYESWLYFNLNKWGLDSNGKDRGKIDDKTIQSSMYVDISNNGTHRVAKNNKLPFVIWDSTSVNAQDPTRNANHAGIVLKILKANDGNWYITGQDTGTDHQSSLLLLCMFPIDHECYKNSFEEVRYRTEWEPSKQNQLYRLPFTTNNAWYVTYNPMYLADAIALCESKGMVLWDHNNNTMDIQSDGSVSQLIETHTSYKNKFLRELGLAPYAPLIRWSGMVMTYMRYSWNDVWYWGRYYDNLAFHPPFFAICRAWHPDMC